MLSSLGQLLCSLLLITCIVVAQSGPTTGPAFRDSDQLVLGALDSLTKSGGPAGVQEVRDDVNEERFESAVVAAGPMIARKELCFRDVYAQPNPYERLFAHQTPALDARGLVVLVSDGVINLANGSRAYKVDHCYPQDEPISVYDYLAMCPFEDRYTEPSWDRGIRLADWDRSLPVFDEPSFLEGFVLPQARANNMALFGTGSGASDEVQSVFEGALEDEANSHPRDNGDDNCNDDGDHDDDDDQPFDPQALEFDEADFGFFSSFENGYPGHDGCDEHGCWSRRIVMGS